MLLNTLHLRFGIGSTALDWFKSYLTGRSQRVTIGSSSSMATSVYHGVGPTPGLGTRPSIVQCIHDTNRRHLQEAPINATYATGPAGVELLFFSLISSANDQKHSPSSHTGRVSRYGVRQREHITPSLRRLHWLPIRMRIMFKICTYMFKAIHGLGPEYINCFVERYMPVRALRSSCNGILLKVTVPRKTIGQSSLSVAGPQMWNNLPIDVRSAQSLMMFRKHLKTYLFRRHYLA